MNKPKKESNPEAQKAIEDLTTLCIKCLSNFETEKKQEIAKVMSDAFNIMLNQTFLIKDIDLKLFDSNNVYTITINKTQRCKFSKAKAK